MINGYLVQNGNGDGLIIYNGDSTSAEEFGIFSWF